MPSITQVKDRSSAHHTLSSPAKEVNELIASGALSVALPGKLFSFDKKDTPQLLQWLKSIGRKDLSLGRIYEGHINALLLIHRFGSEEQKEKWFTDAQNGCLFGVWNTGNDQPLAIHLQNTQQFLLSGKKTFASGAGLVQRALVTGNIQGEGKEGWQMCIINGNELSDDAIDYDSWHPMGMKNSISYTVDLTGYTGAASDLVGNKDNYYQQPYFSAGSIRFCAVQLGGAEAIFNYSIDYLKSLRRTDDPFQQARIAQMATELATGDLWIQQAGIYWDEWSEEAAQKDKLIAFANMTRTAIEGICLTVTELASKCVGARGLGEAFGIGQKIRDLQFYLRQPAPDAALTDVAKYVIQSEQNIEALWHEDNGMEG